MPKEQYIVGLDIGTNLIRVIQAKLEADGSLNVIGVGQAESQGMRKGVIVDIEEAVSSISQALERLERMTGVPVASATVSIGGGHVVAMDSKGVIAISRADGEIGENDIIRVVDASQAVSIPPNREVIHVIPKTFMLDGQGGIKDPLGMTGVRLEVETLIVHASLPYVKNLSKAVMQTGLEIEQLVVAPLAAAQSVLSKRQRELGVVLVDLGAGTTSVAVYEEDNLLHTAVIPIGGMHITNDIAIGLRCTVETAEKVKLNTGHAIPKNIDRHEQVHLSKFDSEENTSIARGTIGEIIEARLDEIFDYVTAELKKINRDGKLPAGVVLSGGGSHLPGIAEFVKAKLRLPSQVGTPANLHTVIDTVDDPSYATAAGLVIWSGRYAKQPFGGEGLSQAVTRMFSGGFAQTVRKWFKSFLP